MARSPLVTGATGFAGSHLVEHLAGLGPEVAAWSNPNGTPIKDAHPQVRWSAVDLLDRDAVFAAIVQDPPTIVYHLAGAADVGGSWNDPVTPLQVNVLGTYHLLDAVERSGLKIPVVVTGSASVYRASDAPLAEDSPLGPSSPYGISKVAQEMVASRITSFPVFLTRPFNHAGPRQAPAFVTSAFARQIAEIETGLSEPALSVGNLDSWRDYTDVRDTVRAYRMVAEAGQPLRPYNVCSGRSYRTGDLLETLLSFSKTRIQVVPDPKRLRPSDTPRMQGDASRIGRDVGWQASIPIEETLRSLLDYWRQRAALPRS